MPIWTPQEMTPEGANFTGSQLFRLRSEFAINPRDDIWDVVTGAGMSMAPAQTSQLSVLAVNAGATANAVWSMISDQAFTAPFRAQASIQLSQKIINQTVYFEVVGWDPVAGATIESDVATWAFTGNDNTTATNATYEVQNGASAKLRAPNQTVPAFVGALTTSAPVTSFELEHLVDEIWWHAKSSDSPSGRTASFKRDTTIPDPNRLYKLRIRVVNGSTAPAAGTTVWLGHVACESYAEQAVELVSGRGGTAAAVSSPVAVTNTPSVNIGANQLLSLSANAAQVAPSTLRIDALTNTVQSIKASANAFLFGAVIYNPNAAMSAVHLYNTVSGETVGTTVPVLTLAVPPTSTLVLPVASLPYLKNATGLRVVATTAATTAGSTAPTTPLVATFMYL